MSATKFGMLKTVNSTFLLRMSAIKLGMLRTVNSTFLNFASASAVSDHDDQRRA